MYAPVALFVYNRPKNTREVVEALKNNYLASETDLFIFSDAPKTERHAKKVVAVREYIKSITGFKSIHIIEREENYYIERNIIEGVSSLIEKYGKIIVLEADGVTAPNFLTFMNDALDFYESEKKVMHIATFTFISLPKDYRKTFFWRYTENTGGGWATWKDRWEKFVWFKNRHEALASLSPAQKDYIELDGSFKCLNMLDMSPIPWDICWYIAVTKNNGLAVNSPHALTKNNGLFNGVHFSRINRILGKHPFETELDAQEDIIFETNIKENSEALALLKEFYEKMGTRLRDKTLHYFIRTLVFFRITKLLKKIFS